MTSLTKPIPAIDASDEEWEAYLRKLTLDELEEFIIIIERLHRQAHKIRLELERQSIVAAA